MATDTGFGFVKLFDDFTDDTINTFRWTANADTGGTTETEEGVVNGVLRLASDGTDGDINNVFGVEAFSAAGGPLCMEARVKMSSLSTGVFVGFTDDNAADEIPIDDDGGTLTTTASTAVGFVYDSGGNDTWDMVSVDDDVDGAQTSTGVAPVADTYQTLRVVVNSDGSAEFFINGKFEGSRTAAVDTDAVLCPAVAQKANGTACNVDVDYIYVKAGRV